MRDILSDLEAGKQLSDENPIVRAQKQMQAQLPKRFYEKAEVAESEGGFAVHLDGRPVKTPARNLLLLPTRAAAQIVADEFAAQEKVIDPGKMPATRLVNTAIDGIAQDPQAVFEDILRFAGTDMLCYRADSPQELVSRQTENWDPLIDWMESLGARFALAEGVMHVEQPREAIAAFSIHMASFKDPLALAALHTMTTLMGSAIIALAVAKGEISAEKGWAIAHIDEDWTIEHWGSDAEAIERRKNREIEMMVAARLLEVL
ncbi:ATPase [Brucella sp. 10RB9214]|uniref:ATP12 family chaperone protein n=1 Tax=unclassified Brucella TaxID=2632610 RepID=UPI000972D6F6|nr:MULTISPECIES: ATP12 family chaperone protein [unclassified Brucella]APY14787.1 ATPase [Brucella sp. 09RB8910]MRN45784.1 ATPase [Brucella sp. 10RB9212]MRN49400.1 ATPase [Brucella sp. 10RB9214]